MTPVSKGFKGQFLDDLPTRPVIMYKALADHSFFSLIFHLYKDMVVRPAVFVPLKIVSIFPDLDRGIFPDPFFALLDLFPSFQIPDKISYQFTILCLFPCLLSVFKGFSIIGQDYMPCSCVVKFKKFLNFLWSPDFSKAFITPNKPAGTFLNPCIHIQIHVATIGLHSCKDRKIAIDGLGLHHLHPLLTGDSSPRSQAITS
ncbi:hypothetical protein ES703_75257 [subsurface metagenome]